MFILSKLVSMFGALRRVLGGQASSSTSAQPSTAAAAVVGTAVAGYVRRLPIDRFFLASRLASVAKLNTPHGRKPRIQVRQSATQPAIPAERLGAKKVRQGANQGLRVLPQMAVKARRDAEIIPFPAARTTGQLKAGSLAKAA